MNFSNDTKLTDVPRIAHHLALATLLAAPIPGFAALQIPKRPAATEPSPSESHQQQTPTRFRGARTYLAMVGPSALTFAETAAPLPPEPVMPAPPKPKPEPTKTPANGNHSANLPPDPSTLKPATETTEPTAKPDDNGPKPINILPDDTRREIRPEDVLPYFQFPGAADNNAPTVIINPAPAAAPPSTATYRQQ